VTGVPVQVCDACGRAVFPARALCPRCGGREHHEELARGGVAEQLTTHRRGGAIASVRTDLGPIVIARAEEDLAPRQRVVLDMDGGAPVARAAAGR
jgi:uncharacterized OB-fold protein